VVPAAKGKKWNLMIGATEARPYAASTMHSFQNEINAANRLDL
jgi:hypothetical protein